MTYADFTLDDIAEKFGYRSRAGSLFPSLTPVDVPTWLTALLAKNTPLAFISEKSRSESIISPILTAAREVTADRLAVFSGQRLDIDPARGLTGECDFILSLADPSRRSARPSSPSSKRRKRISNSDSASASRK